MVDEEIYRMSDGKRIDSQFVSEPPSKYESEKDFTSLVAWKRARKVKLYFYQQVIKSLPPEEKYSLDSQIRRAAISITANIAEGYGRYHYREGLQYYRIARGSLYELKDHLISCSDLDYIPDDILETGLNLIEEAKICLNGFIKFIRNKLKS